MLRFVLLSLFATLVARAVWRLLHGVAQGLSASGSRRATPARGVSMVRDPVCGTFVVPSPGLTLRAGGQDLYFCSEACRKQYRA